MKAGDHMILNSPHQIGQAEVWVIGQQEPIPSGYVLVRCACGSDVAVHEDDLRPMPRAYVDMAGRVTLSVVKENCEED